MPTDHDPQETEVERTTRIPVFTEQQTASFAPVSGDLLAPGPEPEPEPSQDRRRLTLRRGLIVAGAAAGVLVVLYGMDILLSQGAVPRGTTVAGVDIGGLSRADAEQKLRLAVEPRTTQPIKVRAGEVEGTLDARQAGLVPDWSGTLDQAGSQPLNPFARLTSFFARREVPFVSTSDSGKLAAQLDTLRPKVDHDPVEGGIRFEGASPVAVDPKPGQKLDAEGAARSVVDNWVLGTAVPLPVATTPVKVSAEAVREAIEKIAKPAVSGPVAVKGEGKDATLSPAAIAGALGFTATDSGALAPKLDQGKVVEALKPQLASTEKPGNDAEFVFDSGKPVVKPSTEGRGVDWDKSLAGLADLVQRKDNRVLTAQYAKQPAKITTEQAEQLGVKEVVGEFTTGGFAADSGTNIRVVAEKVNGAVVKPGEVFSLNGYTGPRGAPQGYVQAGVIENGAPAREIGGGISQFATTLYNASYFAGLADAGHQEHSYFISRYPAAREATVFQNPDGSSVIDLRFKNDSPNGIAIQTIWTPSQITVKLWGTKRYQVESVPGERTNPVEPQPRQGPATNCVPSAGGPGFTVTDTRVIKDLNGREVARQTRKKAYDPAPKITCGGQ
ncbi:VanW family protein [Kutzneria viridogrisea]|uniref:Vancomycin resistance protein YoaR n=1 Tax=Kutzneria viridogrisea TaxID=47990 RepID=A0ABR6BRV1_9PSEU|nr:vancomycin resistance protein YoaR [Kutzneria viridogrisea]